MFKSTAIIKYPPGSKKAIRKGCTCLVDPKWQGMKIDSRFTLALYYINPKCNLHNELNLWPQQ